MVFKVVCFLCKYQGFLILVIFNKKRQNKLFKGPKGQRAKGPKGQRAKGPKVWL